GSGAVFALRQKDISRPDDKRHAFAGYELAIGDFNRIGDDLGDRHFVVAEPIHERRVGTVLEKAAHQIAEQILVTADRRINPAWPVEFGFTGDLLVESFAHAVQALIFEFD